MSNRKYITLTFTREANGFGSIQINGGDKITGWLDWGYKNQGSKKTAQEICLVLWPDHYLDLYEKFCKDFIEKIEYKPIVIVNVDITEFLKYVSNIVKLKQQYQVECLDDALPF